jgi:hypothetical protein
MYPLCFCAEAAFFAMSAFACSAKSGFVAQYSEYGLRFVMIAPCVNLLFILPLVMLFRVLPARSADMMRSAFAASIGEQH